MDKNTTNILNRRIFLSADCYTFPPNLISIFRWFSWLHLTNPNTNPSEPRPRETNWYMTPCQTTEIAIQGTNIITWPLCFKGNFRKKLCFTDILCDFNLVQMCPINVFHTDLSNKSRANDLLFFHTLSEPLRNLIM